MQFWPKEDADVDGEYHHLSGEQKNKEPIGLKKAECERLIPFFFFLQFFGC